MKQNKTNPRISCLIQSLYDKSMDSKSALWKDLAKRFESPRQNWAEINIKRLNWLTKKDETIVVPGKVLALGELDHKVDVYVFSASDNVKAKIEKAGGSTTEQ